MKKTIFYILLFLVGSVIALIPFSIKAQVVNQNVEWTKVAMFSGKPIVRDTCFIIKNGSDSVIISIHSDTVYFRSTCAAWKFTPPLPGGSSSGWGLSGNAGTNPASNFIGTTDSSDLIIKANGIERERFARNGQWTLKSSFADNDTFIAEISNNALGYGLNAGRFQHVTLDGSSGIIVMDGTSFSKTRNYWANGFTDYVAKNSIIEGGYDSITGNSWAQIQVQNDNDIRYTARFSTDSGLEFNIPITYIDGNESAGKILTSNSSGLCIWAGLDAANGSQIPSYPNNTAAVAILGTGKLYYTDVAGEHVIKVTH